MCIIGISRRRLSWFSTANLFYASANRPNSILIIFHGQNEYTRPESPDPSPWNPTRPIPAGTDRVRVNPRVCRYNRRPLTPTQLVFSITGEFGVETRKPLKQCDLIAKLRGSLYRIARAACSVKTWAVNHFTAEIQKWWRNPTNRMEVTKRFMAVR